MSVVKLNITCSVMPSVWYFAASFRSLIKTFGRGVAPASNFFRGILHGEQLSLKALRLSAGWCGNVLRMVTPHLWLGPDLAAQVDYDALRRVADVSEVNGCLKVVKLAEASMEHLEIALLPILPIESARIRVTA